MLTASMLQYPIHVWGLHGEMQIKLSSICTAQKMKFSTKK